MVTKTDILLQALYDDTFLDQQIDTIHAIVKELPYFQAAWALSTRYLKLQNSYISLGLQQSAARSINRERLFDFINKNKVQKSISKVSKIENKQISQPDSAQKPTIKTSTSLQFKAKKPENVEKTNKSNKIKIVKPVPRMITKATPKKSSKQSDKKNKQVNIEPQTRAVSKNTKKEPEKVIKPEFVAKSDILKGNKIVDNQSIASKNQEIKQNIKLSYAEWLQRFKTQKKQKNTSNIDLIEKFLKERPKIVPKRNQNVQTPKIIEKSISEKQMLMTETLANLYVKQKKYEKAIQAFRILSLKYPKKSSYFANQIKEIEQKLK